MLYLLLLWSMSVYGALEVIENCLIPNRLGECALVHNGDNFQVINKQEIRNVHRYDVPEHIRDMSQERMLEFIKKGYLTLSKAGDDYKIYYHHRMRGGGPILGAVAYWGTKTVCYGLIAGGIIQGIRKVGKKASKAANSEVVATVVTAGTAILEGIATRSTAPGVPVVAEAMQASEIGREVGKATAGVVIMTTAEVTGGGVKIVAGIEALASWLGSVALLSPLP